MLGPPWCATQWLFSRSTGQLFRVKIRDNVDAQVMEQVFGNEDYDLRRLPHWRRISLRYAELVLAGRTPLIVDCGADTD